jgi:hypothetical protein
MADAQVEKKISTLATTKVASDFLIQINVEEGSLALT